MGAGINNADESFTTFIKDLIESKFTEKMLKDEFFYNFVRLVKASTKDDSI